MGDPVVLISEEDGDSGKLLATAVVIWSRAGRRPPRGRVRGDGWTFCVLGLGTDDIMTKGVMCLCLEDRKMILSRAPSLRERCPCLPSLSPSSPLVPVHSPLPVHVPHTLEPVAPWHSARTLPTPVRTHPWIDAPSRRRMHPVRSLRCCLS